MLTSEDYARVGISVKDNTVYTNSIFNIPDNEVISRSKAIQIAKEFASEAQYAIDSDIKVFLFGSAVKNNATQESDIDIALVSDKLEGLNSVHDICLYAPIISKVCLRLEPHTYNTAQWNNKESVLIPEIIETGVEIV